MSKKKVLVLGGNFAGLTAAISVKHELGNDVDVTVVSKADHFQFNPSLIWIPFGKRKARDVAFPLAKTFEAHGVEFVHAEATKIDPPGPEGRDLPGRPRLRLPGDRDRVPERLRRDPRARSRRQRYSITSLQGAVDAAQGWARFLNEPVRWSSGRPRERPASGRPTSSC